MQGPANFAYNTRCVPISNQHVFAKFGMAASLLLVSFKGVDQRHNDVSSRDQRLSLTPMTLPGILQGLSIPLNKLVTHWITSEHVCTTLGDKYLLQSSWIQAPECRMASDENALRQALFFVALRSFLFCMTDRCRRNHRQNSFRVRSCGNRFGKGTP